MFKEKELIIFDIDRTIYNGSFGNDFIFYLVSKQIISSKIIPLIGFEIGNYFAKSKSYDVAVSEILNALSNELDGLSTKLIENEVKNFIKINHHKFYDFAYELPKIYSDKYDFLIVSLEPDFIVKEISIHLGIPNSLGNKFEIQNNKFASGNKVITNKLEMLKKSDFNKKFLLATFGDSESDFELLQNSEYPFLVEPTPYMIEISKDQNFKVINPETATLEFKKIPNLSL